MKDTIKLSRRGEKAIQKAIDILDSAGFRAKEPIDMKLKQLISKGYQELNSLKNVRIE